MLAMDSVLDRCEETLCETSRSILCWLVTGQRPLLQLLLPILWPGTQLSGLPPVLEAILSFGCPGLPDGCLSTPAAQWHPIPKRIPCASLSDLGILDLGRSFAGG